MRNGKLRHKMTLQEPVTTQDTTTGEMVTVWTDVAKVWASLEPLSANAFVAAGAEQSEVTARATIRYRGGVTSKMRLVYRGMYYDIKGVLADPKSGLEYLTLPVGEGVRYENPAPPAPPVCTITLTHDGLDAFGLEPMSVTGQTVSVTGDGSSDYGTWTGAAGVPVNWAGVRVVEIETKDYTTGEHGFIIATAGFDSAVEVFWRAGTGEWIIRETGGSVNVSGTALDSMAVGIDGATGDVIFYQNGSQVDTSTLAGLSGMFSGKSAIIIPSVSSLALGDTYSAEIITQSDKYTQTYPAGTLDWCGNPI